MQGRKQRKKRYFIASALAGAYIFCLFVVIFANFAIISGKSEVHPREKLCSFTTYFNQKDGGRCENIRLAAARLDGIALQPYGELSFNRVVGARTKSNGYKTAKVILQGEFVEGIGGGVCQVSTTLYNAALLSGLVVLEYHPHSMRVGYVAPSRDAMVTEYNDLCLYNPYSETVYISSLVGEGYVRFTIRGKPTGKTYSIESKTLTEIPPPEPMIELGTADETIRAEQAGIKSESYLKTYQNGVLVSVKRLRMDEYAPQRGILRKKS